MQGPRKHLKLGGHDTLRACFSLRRRGHVLNMKWALLCLLKILGGAHAPSAPSVPTSLQRMLDETNPLKSISKTVRRFLALDWQSSGIQNLESPMLCKPYSSS